MRYIARILFRIVKKIIFKRNIISYTWGGMKPWSRGYFEYKWECIKAALIDEKLLSIFRNGDQLPPRFGIHIDERIVEYPWVISLLPKEPVTLLDAGSALNFEAILAHLALKNKKITIATLSPEANCFWYKNVSYVFEDMRHLPFLSDSYEIITCISTLEHVGMNNMQIYTSDTRYKESKTKDYLIAAKELRRVLKPGGSLFITVPFGAYGDFGFFQQFDERMLQSLEGVFGADNCKMTFYRYTEDGWQISTKNECISAKYITADRAKASSPLPAAASAVACLELTK